MQAGLLQRLSNTNNSNEARLKLLERRLTGEMPSPRSLTFDGHLRHTLDDATSSRYPLEHADRHTSDDDSTGLARSAERALKKRKVSPHSDQQDQNQQTPYAGRSVPLRQVTNQNGCKSSHVAKHDSHQKPSPVTSPTSNRLLQRNTISKYFPGRGQDGMERVSICTQTHVSLQEQEQNMQSQLLTTFTIAENAQ